MRSKTRPLLFVTEVLGATPEPWQAAALEAVGKHDRVSIRSGHGRGEDYVAGVARAVVLAHAQEASGIPDVVVEVGLGALSTPGAKVVMAGNPTRTSGFFHDTHHSLRDRWHTMHVSCLDVQRAQRHVEDIKAKYGTTRMRGACASSVSSLQQMTRRSFLWSWSYLRSDGMCPRSLTIQCGEWMWRASAMTGQPSLSVKPIAYWSPSSTGQASI